MHCNAQMPLMQLYSTRHTDIALSQPVTPSPPTGFPTYPPPLILRRPHQSPHRRVGHRQDNRRQQMTTDLTPSKPFVDVYQPYLNQVPPRAHASACYECGRGSGSHGAVQGAHRLAAQVVGFFLVEDQVLRASSGITSGAAVDGLWENALSQIKARVNARSSLSGRATPQTPHATLVPKCLSVCGPNILYSLEYVISYIIQYVILYLHTVKDPKSPTHKP